MEGKEINDKLKQEIHNLKVIIANDGIESGNNLENLYKLVDIEKDLCEIEKGGTEMRYEDYGREDYGRRRRDSRGRYMGHEHLDRMHDEYNRYEEGREQYNRGDYNAKEDSIKSLEYMLESAVDLVKMLYDKAQSQEEINIIRKYTKKMSEM